MSIEPDMFVRAFAGWKHRLQQWIHQEGDDLWTGKLAWLFIRHSGIRRQANRLGAPPVRTMEVIYQMSGSLVTPANPVGYIINSIGWSPHNSLTKSPSTPSLDPWRSLHSDQRSHADISEFVRRTLSVLGNAVFYTK
jgi:hypothetical protein